MIVDGGDGTLTPTTFHDGSTITFDDVGESVVLVYHTTIGWKAVSVNQRNNNRIRGKQWQLTK